MTLFDVLTVTCFLGMTGTFFVYGRREPRALAYLIVSGFVFAVANQVGNAGYDALAWLLISAGIGNAVLALKTMK